ncbi:transcriptional regulator [Corynebacterium aurimucosum]|nr:transcriptional regulator [Corynebacterium aurimucosum]
MNNMINALANYTLNEIERASRDEFERETFYKAYAISATPKLFLEFVAAAILAWVLPGQMSMLCFLAIAPSIIGNLFGTAWLRKRVATPSVGRNWSAMAVYLIPLIVMFVGIAHNAYAPDSTSYLVGAAAGVTAAIIFTPFLRRRQHQRDQARLDAELDD